MTAEKILKFYASYLHLLYERYYQSKKLHKLLMFEKFQRFANFLSHQSSREILELFMKSESGKVRYKDLKEITSNEVTLKRRLDEMKELKIVTKKTLDEEKFRPTLYKLTTKGERVLELMEEFERTF